ncbi:MAG: hypothetical protein Q9191_003244 [Dirinaria sp. TL-2023a]
MQLLARCERAHGKFKNGLGISTGGLKSAVDAIERVLRNEYLDFVDELAGDKIRLPYAHFMKRKKNNNEVLMVEDIRTHWWFNKPRADEQITVTNNTNEQTSMLDDLSDHGNDTDPEADVPADTHRGIASDEDNENSNNNDLLPLIVDPALQVVEPDAVQPKCRPQGSRNKKNKRSRPDDDDDTMLVNAYLVNYPVP